jgi:hypothetical protein
MRIPNWMGEYLFEEEGRMAYILCCWKKVSYLMGYGFTFQVINQDIWGENPA